LLSEEQKIPDEDSVEQVLWQTTTIGWGLDLHPIPIINPTPLIETGNDSLPWETDTTNKRMNGKR